MRALILLLLSGSALATSPYEEKHMEDECFNRIRSVFSAGAKVSGVDTVEGRENNRSQYITTFTISGSLPYWYREHTVSCYFDKSTKRYLSDDVINTRRRSQRIQEEKREDAQERFKVQRYNSMR